MQCGRPLNLHSFSWLLLTSRMLLALSTYTCLFIYLGWITLKSRPDCVKSQGCVECDLRMQVGDLSIEGSHSVGLYAQHSWETHTRTGFNNNRKRSGVQSFCRASCCHRCICSLIKCPLWIQNAPQTTQSAKHPHSLIRDTHTKQRHSHAGRTNWFRSEVQIEKCTQASNEKQTWHTLL